MKQNEHDLTMLMKRWQIEERLCWGRGWVVGKRRGGNLFPFENHFLKYSCCLKTIYIGCIQNFNKCCAGVWRWRRAGFGPIWGDGRRSWWYWWRQGERQGGNDFLLFKIVKSWSVLKSLFQLGRIAQKMALDEDQANLKLFQDRSFNWVIHELIRLQITKKLAGFWRMVIFTLITRGRGSSSGLVSMIE